MRGRGFFFLFRLDTIFLFDFILPIFFAFFFVIFKINSNFATEISYCDKCLLIYEI